MWSSTALEKGYHTWNSKKPAVAGNEAGALLSAKAKNRTVTIYTDGGCEPNPGVGGWAAVLMYNGARREISGGEFDTTNNRMELTAAIEALETLTRPCVVELHTDSEYVQRGISEWLPKWKANGWKRGKRGEVKNLDLWQRLDQAAARHDIRWAWVRGHTGVEENERCDVLAAQEIAKRRAALRSGLH